MQAALRGVSWMADAGDVPADTAAAREFLRGLPESQRRAIVTRAHSVLRAVLERAAASPPASPRAPPASSLPVSQKGAPPEARRPQPHHGASASAVLGLPAQSLPEPRLSTGSPRTPAAGGSATDLYSAFAEAAGGTPHGASPAVSRCSSGRAAASPAECSAAAVTKAAEAAPGLAEAAAIRAGLPGHSVLVAEPGCTTCQAATLSDSRTIGSTPTSASTVSRALGGSNSSIGSGNDSTSAMQLAAPLHTAFSAPSASPFAATAAAAARQAGELPPTQPKSGPLLNTAPAGARQADMQRQDSHTLLWQQAMQAQQTFAAKRAASETARGAADGVPSPQHQPHNVLGDRTPPVPASRRASDPAAFGGGMAVTEDALAATGDESGDEVEEMKTFERPTRREVQRQSLDMALAAMPIQRMALHFDDVKICRRPNGELWKLGSGGFGTVSSRVACAATRTSKRCINPAVACLVTE